MNILEYINKMQEMYGDVVKKPGEVERPQQADGGRIGFAQGTPQRLSLINNLKSTIAEAKKTNNYGLLKAARRETGGVLSEQTAKFLNIAANDKDYAKSFAKELGISTKEFNSLLDKRATAIQEYGRSASQKSSLKRVNPNKIKMINLINEGVNDTSLLAKKLKISKTKVNEIGNALYKDIYATSSAIGKGATKTTGTGIATFLTDNPKNLNSLLDKMHNVKGLETVEQRQIKKLLGEAFGDGKNPKLFKLYNNKINEYYDLKKKLAGKINLNLDHPLSSQMIKNLKLGKEAKLFVEPLTAEINQGTKSLLDKTYAKAFASKSPDRTAKMKAVVNLAKKIELPLGTTKIISEPFYKQDIPKKIIEAAKTQNRVIKNIKNLPKEEIQKIFKDKRTKLISPDVKPIDTKKILKFFKDSGIPCIKGVGGNCTSINDYQKGYNKLVEEGAQGSKQAIQKLGKFTKTMRGITGVAKYTGYGLLAEAGFMIPFAVGDYAAGKKWSRIIGNATDYGFGPIFGQSELEEFKAALPKGSAAVQAENVLSIGDEIDRMEKQKVNPGYGRIGFQERAPIQRQKVYDAKLDKYFLNMQPFIRPSPHIDVGQFYDQNLFDKAMQEGDAAREKIMQEDLIRQQQRDLTNPMDFMAAGGGLAGLSGGDKSGPPPASGPASQGLRSLIKNGRKL